MSSTVLHVLQVLLGGLRHRGDGRGQPGDEDLARQAEPAQLAGLLRQGSNRRISSSNIRGGVLAPMRRVGDAYVEASWDEAIADIAARMTALIDADGPDAIGAVLRQSDGLLVVECVVHDGLARRCRHPEPLRGRLGGPERDARRRGRDVRIDSDGAGVRHRQLRLLFVDRYESGCQRVELAGNGAGRLEAGTGAADVRAPRSSSWTRCGRRPPSEADLHLAVRPGQDWALLLGMVKVILDDGLEHVGGLPRPRNRCGRASRPRRRRRPRRPGSAMRRPAARHRANRKGFRTSSARDGRHPHRCFIARDRNDRRMARPRAQRDHRTDGPTRRAQVRVRLRRRAEVVRLGHTAHAQESRARPELGRRSAHALAELPDEITTPGRGQIRAMVINCGNPVVSGPDGAKLDAALSQLDLLVAIDLVQRESHRHAHWLLPAAHWLERDDLMALTSNLHDEPYVQYGRRAVDPPPRVREEWRIFVDLAIAMRKPLFGAKGLNGS